MTDRGRAEVYAAELVAFDGTELEVVEPFDRLVALAADLVGGPWWPAGAVVVRPARRDAATSTARWSSGGVTIRLAAPQCTRATLVHELAHVLARPDAGHGPAFRRAHVDVASAVVGHDRAGWLAAAYRAHGLEIGDRAWPPPPSSSWSSSGDLGPIAL